MPYTVLTILFFIIIVIFSLKNVVVYFPLVTPFLAASLQIKFVGAVNGLSLETLEIDDVSAQDAAGDDAEAASPYPGLGFVMSVSGSADALRELLVRFEQSIRVIRLNAVTVEAGVDRLTMNIIGEAYYQPSQVVRLESRVVKP